MNPSETVQQIYEAFSRGDVPTILAHLAEDVDWEYGGSTAVPWLEPRHGRESVAGFFLALQALEFHTFRPTQILSEGDVVLTLLDLEVTVKATGKRIVETDEVHVWRFNPSGKVQRFRHRADTLQHYLALKP